MQQGVNRLQQQQGHEKVLCKECSCFFSSSRRSLQRPTAHAHSRLTVYASSQEPRERTLAPKLAARLAPVPTPHQDGHGMRLGIMASASAATPAGPTQHASSGLLFDPLVRAQERRARLETLVELRALYRNFVRAKYLLRLETPVYNPPAAGPEQPDSSHDGEDADDMRRELEEQERRREAVEVVGEMLMTAEQLKVGLRTVPAGFGSLFSVPSPGEAEAHVRDQARKYIAQLRERITQELVHLPFGSEAAAIAAIEARNARYWRPTSGTTSTMDVSGSSSSAGNGSNGGGQGLVLPGGQDAAQQLASKLNQLGKAEKVAEQFMATRIKPVLRKARETEFVDLVKETGQYLKGLWIRLNGGGSRLREPPLSPDLPLPVARKDDVQLAISQLSLELDGIESRLREAARAREARLRKARAPEGRATMPFQLKTMDEEVLRLSRELAIRTLQLELEYSYSSLEDEMLDILGSDVNELLSRQGSSSELRLLSAEFSMLDEQLAALAAQLGRGGSSSSSGSSSNSASSSGAHSAPGTGGAATIHTAPSTQLVASLASSNGSIARVVDVGGLPVGVEDLLELLATEVPDMRQRVGVPDQVVFGGQGFTFTKARLQVKEALDKVREALTFMVRGIKLLGSDISSATRLFGKAAIGGTLKPREVSALRRTARDLLAFIPFTIILIIPLSPVGHVLVFGFIQQYFPSLYPTCFTSRRQDMMIKYEELERQLLAAREKAEVAEEEAELVRAAVQRLAAAPAGAGAGPAAGGSSAALPAAAPHGSTEAGPAPRSKASTAASAAGKGDGASGSSRPASSKSGSSATAAGPDLADWKALSSADEAAAVAAAQQTAQVKELEEKVAAVYDDVTLGDDTPSTESAQPSHSTKRRAARKA